MRGPFRVAPLEPTYLDDVYEDPRGYIAIAKVYDGPICVLFIVDNGAITPL